MYFIPDFYCAEKKLVVELDGGIHKYQKEKGEFQVTHAKHTLIPMAHHHYRQSDTDSYRAHVENGQ